MLHPKPKKDRDIFQFLVENLSDKYEVYYKNYIISLEHFNFKIDFTIVLKEEFLEEKDRHIIYYVQNAQSASLSKLTQIYELLLSYTSVSVIWDGDSTKNKFNLVALIKTLNELAHVTTNEQMFSQPLNFLLFCDEQEEIEMIRYRTEIYSFNETLRQLEIDHGLVEEEIEEEEDNTEEV